MTVLSGVKTVTAAGTAERLHAGLMVNGPVMVKALLGNSATVYVGNVNGDVDSSNGLPLAAGEVLILHQVGNLMEVWLDAAVNGEGAAWLRLEV